MSVLNKIQIVVVIVVVAIIAMLVIAVFVNPIMAISGVYTMQEMYDSSYRAAFESMAGVDSEEFKVNANPDYEQYDEYILLPFTNIRRDGSLSDYGYTVTAGDFYSTGTTHYAFAPKSRTGLFEKHLNEGHIQYKSKTSYITNISIFLKAVETVFQFKLYHEGLL